MVPKMVIIFKSQLLQYCLEMCSFDIQLQCKICWWKRFQLGLSKTLPSFRSLVARHVPLTKESRANFIGTGEEANTLPEYADAESHAIQGKYCYR